ncbi:hypothetical protein PA01_00100 [Azoarcus sp. PA01]|nr:hypothetical protein PA01_19335 [Azoarcus sp. PA01]KON82499.1 hypothetical protein PA01_00100 [Azoarcus sp. PA01]
MTEGTISRWLSDLALLPDIDVEAWQPFIYDHTCVLLQAGELADALAALGPVTGWLTEAGCVRRLHDETIALTGFALDGEFFRDTVHWQLSRLPRGRWQLNAHRVQPCSAADATHLGEPTSHLLAGRPGARLQYWRLWTAGPDNAPHCPLAVLAGIEDSRS